jgi:hypothetical protein
MILLFTPKITNRVQYIAKTILLNICGFDYKVTNSSEEFLNFKGGKINYSNREFPGTSLRVYASGFLLQKGVKEFVPATMIKDKTVYLFPKDDSMLPCDLGFDIFSACFYMLSRYEEYLPFLEDRHGRFEADQSLAYQLGFLDVPIVDIYAMELKSRLLELFPFTDARSRSFQFIPTYDIDIAYAYKGKGLTRNILAIAKDILSFQFRNLITRINVMSNQMKDPYDTYDFQLELQKEYKLKPVYFFLSGQFGPKDRNISIHSKTFFNLVKTIGDYAVTGIHPSYESNFNEKALKQEYDFLSGMLHRTIQHSRQHYLRVRLPQTYQNLIKIDIRYDYSMGFASHTGFRAGTCTPFNFYDLSQESETRLKIFPLTLMDGTLKDYMKLKPGDALERTKKLVDTVKAVNGTFVSLWHNDALNNQDQWEGWQQVYIDMIRYIKELPQNG